MHAYLKLIVMSLCLMTSVLLSTNGRAQETREPPACKSGSRVEISCQAALACWDERSASKELGELRPACRELRRERDDLVVELAGERALRGQDQKRALESDRQARELEEELARRPSWAAIIGAVGAGGAMGLCAYGVADEERGALVSCGIVAVVTGAIWVLVW